ncbi:MAG TPA: hypothetical protein VNA04_08115 [Thermoanaerobaculia bacterium]|nr:hypothetical protein [Thermoanaerobaculia bacterium]
MKRLLLVLLSLTAPLEAQDWSVGAGGGAFVWGHFVKRTTTIATEDGTTRQTVTLSATTRPGMALDIERRLGERFALRLEGSFARSPLGIKGTSRQDPAVTISAGDIDVTAVTMPLVVRINPRGTFRFHIMGGPAAAAYTIRIRPDAAGTIPLFRGTRNEWGAAAGAGMGWYPSDRFAIEANALDINTSSPFRREDIGGLGTVEISRPHNLHTTIGIRYGF